MAVLHIDGRSVEVADGSTILDAARALGITIPTLCFLAGTRPTGACMVCLVRIQGQDALAPACGMRVADGMEVDSETAEVHAARRQALELLLAEHRGDCLAPCQRACPARMNIPAMIRAIREGRIDEAIRIVKQDIPLPAILGRVCSAPCEKVCRRGAVDQPVAICLLKRWVGDQDLKAAPGFVPTCAASSGKRVAIVGAGPAGLSAAWYLRLCGHACTIYEAGGVAGGMVRSGVDPARLPPAVVEAEIKQILALGVALELNSPIGARMPLDILRTSYDAVLVAAGAIPPAQRAADFSLLASEADDGTHRHDGPMGCPGVFTAGAFRAPTRMAVQALASGKEAAGAIDRFLRGQAPVVTRGPFSTRVGKMTTAELKEAMQGCRLAATVAPADGLDRGYAQQEAIDECERCLHCDCRKVEDCRLRQWSVRHDANPARYPGKHRDYSLRPDHPALVYEPGKCIACGICIRVTQQAGEKVGLTFAGRGFAVRVAPPLGHTLAEAVTHSAAEVIRACPTGAFAPRTY